MKDQVCAVVVTFNRKALLSECLNGLLRQSRLPDTIIIVNNASTDGTRDMLATDFPQLTVLDLAANIGGAGGFREGMKWAYERGFEWIWVMDDDVEPVPDALEAMLGYNHIADFIHSRKEFRGTPVPWEGVWDMSLMQKRCFSTDISFDNGRDWIPVNSSCFEGALMRRTIIDKVGLPDERFFVCGDDILYGFLASLKTNVIYINHVGFQRKLPLREIDERKLYFDLRNRFLLYTHLKAAGVPLSRPAFWVNNLLSVFWVLRKRPYHLFRKVQAVATALRDGAHGRFGRPAWL